MLYDDADLLCVGGGAHDVDRFADDGRQVHGPGIEPELARHDARDVEDILYQLRLRLSVPADRIEPLQDRGIADATSEQRRPAKNRVERSA